jgi:general secretion pathway protein J
MTRTAATQGFSLVEMLVALGVLGLAMVLLAGMIGQVGYGLTIWDRDDTQLADVAAAQFTLRQRLGAMQPVRDIQAGGDAIDAGGHGESVDFVAPAPDRDAPDALRRYRLARDAAGNLTLFSLSTLDARVDAHALSTAGWQPEPLMAGIARLEIRYWGRDPIAPTARSTAWQADWTRRTALPMLVMIRVSFPDGDRRAWPDLVIHPRAAVPEACPETMPCAVGNLVARRGTA